MRVEQPGENDALRARTRGDQRERLLLRQRRERIVEELAEDRIGASRRGERGDLVGGALADASARARVPQCFGKVRLQLGHAWMTLARSGLHAVERTAQQ